MSRASRNALRPALLTGAWGAVAVWLVWRAAWPKAGEVVAAFRGPLDFHAGAFAAWWARNAAAAALAALVAAAAAGIGSAASAWLGASRRVPRAEEAPATLLAGLGLYACAAIAFGLCGLLFMPVAALVLAGLVASAWASRGRLRRLLRAPARPFPVGARALRAACWVLGGLAALFCLTPETWWDSLFYHLNAPSDFNDLHKWVDIPQAVYRYPLLAESLFSQGMLLEGEQTATLINLVPLVFLAWLLREWAARWGGVLAGWLAVLILLVSDQIGFHLGQANQGFFSIGLAFAGVWAWSLTARGPSSIRCALASGALLGWAMCAKYTAVVPLAGMLAWETWRAFRQPRESAVNVAWMAAGFLAATTAFLANDWLFTGNPVYPFVFGGLDWSDENAWVMNEFGCPGSDFSLGDPWSLGRATLEYLTVQQPLAMLALPALAGVDWRRAAPFATAWGVAFLVWAGSIPCLRLMMPAYPATALLAAVGFARWFGGRRFGNAQGPGPRRAIAWMSVATVATLGAIQPMAAADFHKRSFNAALGLESSPHYMSRILTSYWRMHDEVEKRIPFGVRVLAVGEGRGYPFSAHLLNRGPEDSPEILTLVRRSFTPDIIGKRFRKREIRYLLLNFVSSEFHSRLWMQVFQWRPAELTRWWTYWREHSTVLWMDPQPDGINGGFVLYRVDDRPHAPPALLPFLPGAEAAVVRKAGEERGTYLDRLRELERITPGVVFFDARLAAQLLEAGRPEEALRYASRGLATDYPEKEALFGLRGMALMRLKRFAEAADAFRAAERLRPDESEFTRLRREAERGTPGR